MTYKPNTGNSSVGGTSRARVRIGRADILGARKESDLLRSVPVPELKLHLKSACSKSSTVSSSQSLQFGDGVVFLTILCTLS